MKKIFSILWAFLMLLCISLNAQTLSPTVISSSGGFFASGSKSLSFTIAEMTMVQSFFQPSNILTQGFQQPEQLTTSINENKITGEEVLIYPNPSNGHFVISFKANEESNYRIKIFDLVGRIIFDQSYTTVIGPNNLKINISKYSQGVYYLEISNGTSNDNKKSGVFKINLVY